MSEAAAMAAPTPDIAELVAHYLQTTYPAVLPSFLAAANRPAPDPARPPVPDLRTVVQDYLSVQLAASIQALALSSGNQSGRDESEQRATDGSWRGWRTSDVMKLGMPQEEGLSGVVRSVEGVSAGNLIAVSVGNVPSRRFDTATAAYQASHTLSVLTSSVDKSIKIIDYLTGEVDRILEPHKAAILSFSLHPTQPRYLLTGSMDGTTVLTDLITDTALQTFRSQKFVIRVAFSPTGRWMATASYDRQIVIYEAVSGFDVPAQRSSDDAGAEELEDEMLLDDTDDHALAIDPTLRYEERHRVKVDSNPEAIVFHPKEEWLMYTVRESHLLHYVRLPTSADLPAEDMHVDGSSAAGSSNSAGAWTATSKSFNPHPMDTHVSFAVLDLALHPSGKVIACLTGDHRGGAGERVLLYGTEPDETERLGCLWTGGDSDDFVLPRMAWLPDGTGLITTTANGYLNLVTMQGEVRSSVKVHGSPTTVLGQASSEVVRDVAVISTPDGGWEAVSVGYDRTIRISR